MCLMYLMSYVSRVGYFGYRTQVGEKHTHECADTSGTLIFLACHHHQGVRDQPRAIRTTLTAYILHVETISRAGGGKACHTPLATKNTRGLAFCRSQYLAAEGVLFYDPSAPRILLHLVYLFPLFPPPRPRPRGRPRPRPRPPWLPLAPEGPPDGTPPLENTCGRGGNE